LGVFLAGWIIGNNGLSGEIPTEFAQMDGIRVLNLYNNSIDGTIPDEFGDLTDLNELILGKWNCVDKCCILYSY